MKKIVNILIMETKPLSLDLIRKAIHAKPDSSFDLKIVGTASTAKAGYFEMYKHKPHLLFLNPELPDEDGESFIQHALERLPQLKIIPMISRFQDEEQLLQAGAADILHLPVQRAPLWRKIDQIVQELDELGVLEHFQDIHDEEEDTTPITKELFVLDDSEQSDFTPIFADINEEKSNEQHRETSQNESINLSQNPVKMESSTSIIADDEPTVIQLNDNGLSNTAINEEEEEDLVEFNPFKSHSNSTNLDDKADVDDMDSTSSLQTDKEDSNKGISNDPPLSFFDFDKADHDHIDNIDDFVYGHEDNTIEIPKENIDIRLNPLVEVSTYEDSETKSLDTKDSTQVSQKDIGVAEGDSSKSIDESNVENSSNTPRTSKNLYYESNEYNKTTFSERKTFEKGFINKHGHFVPITQPPRERFSQHPQQVLDATLDVEESFKVKTEEIDTSTDRGILKSVKNIFKR